ncbi:hypothetical protein BACOVA_01926 [Bacteroides ovatus ATCC 8483]|uniref:Uncharacterized protein n=1 Tax=Bacteroides ovatus (strain ATCC 8483 / DSM 1896 / JCM 5824 / BCRC 10623 / CCUG 4943 / NCTC 11153) TaxID=411476 RepID=A0AAN3D8Y8_BACO1|nr:hypothetical protein BACOVA_01926 [Bacteroides ovatus ATCC 8483]
MIRNTMINRQFLSKNERQSMRNTGFKNVSHGVLC